jgi:cell volume regulation protein A
MDLVYIVAPLLLISVVLAAVWLERWSVPVIVVALGAGILFGSDVLNFWNFNNALLTSQAANIALVFILFQGGFGTKRNDFKSVALPAGGLATWGVVLTATVTLVVLWKLFGWPFEKACLLAVIISSTDAAATFSILRRQSLPRKLSSTIEIESAANDPMAVLLTVMAVQSFAHGETPIHMVALSFLWKFTAGPALGWLLAHAALWLFNRLRPQDRGHYYVLFLGVVLLTYGAAEAIHASGMLAVFIAGYVMGNHPFVHKQGVANFSSALSTVANIGMFVLMGLLVFPHQWKGIWMDGLILFAVLTFAARPLAVALGTIGMHFSPKKKLFIMWAGLRGAVPIVLATYPAAAGLPGSQDIFNLVFFAVFLSMLVQGSTLGGAARLFGFSTRARPKPLYNLELITMAESDLDLIEIDLPGPQGIAGPMIQNLPLPPSAVITLITRGAEVVSPKGQTRLNGWDQVTVLAHVKDEEIIRHALLNTFRQSVDEGDPENAGTE